MDRDQGGASANSSSDFVRKLYKMLEESQYANIVRWGDDGESFVVIEIDEFTKNVLPRHFKHSNFASFVRQLNKYDFHKVRQSNEESGPNTYGPNSWEFKHPEFQKNGKDSLDNIRRKAPAPRKTNQVADDQYPTQQMDLLNTQLVATQQQFSALHEKHSELQQAHMVMLGNTVRLHRTVKGHHAVLDRVVGALQNLEAENRRLTNAQLFSANNSAMSMEGLAPRENGANAHILSPIRQAADLLAEHPIDDLLDKELERMAEEFALYRSMEFGTPPDDPNSAISMSLQNIGESAPNMDFGDLNGLDMVYPIGQTRGIDPINKDHINNIPYGVPQRNGQSSHGVPDVVDATNGSESFLPRAGGVRGPLWTPRNPRVMLVEDDRTCSRIGQKFLKGFECSSVLAKDGLEAVSKMNMQPESERIDLILMDIIMPKLDGVSATAVIREQDQVTPIIAMTSNIRTDDIEVYFRYGMNDVLPKPFTKEGMLRILEKHLASFKAHHPVPNADQPPGCVNAGLANPTLNMNSISHISAPHSIKDDSPAARSPATSWHSPNSNSLTCPSPTSAGPPGDVYNIHPLRQGATGGYVMGNPTSGLRNMESPTQQNMAAPRQGIQHRRVMSDMTNGPEEHPEAKRQRMFNPQLPNNSNNFT